MAPEASDDATVRVQILPKHDKPGGRPLQFCEGFAFHSCAASSADYIARVVWNPHAARPIGHAASSRHDAPNPLSRRPGLSAIRMAGLVAALGVAAACSGTDATTRSSDTVVGSGKVTIGSDEYTFAPTTCLAQQDNVVAEGPGGDDALFVTVDTGGTVTVAFGVASGSESPADGEVWYKSVDDARFAPAEDGFAATVTFVDANGDLTQEVDGAVWLQCDRQA